MLRRLFIAAEGKNLARGDPLRRLGRLRRTTHPALAIAFSLVQMTGSALVTRHFLEHIQGVFQVSLGVRSSDA
jgi:cytochrome b subunit of formate dehydrogenase